MIEPTVGRVVWVYRALVSLDPRQPEVGLITYVHHSRCINVAGYNANGAPFTLSSLTLVQPEDETPRGDHAIWMPYQKGQAAKTEEALARNRTE